MCQIINLSLTAGKKINSPFKGELFLSHSYCPAILSYWAANNGLECTVDHTQTLVPTIRAPNIGEKAPSLTDPTMKPLLSPLPFIHFLLSSFIRQPPPSAASWKEFLTMNRKDPFIRSPHLFGVKRGVIDRESEKALTNPFHYRTRISRQSRHDEHSF